MTRFVTEDKGPGVETGSWPLELGNMEVMGDSDNEILACHWEGGSGEPGGNGVKSRKGRAWCW